MISETLEILVYVYFIECFNFTIPQTPEEKLKEASPNACDLNVRSACPFGPNIEKPVTKTLLIELFAYVMSGIYKFNIY